MGKLSITVHGCRLLHSPGLAAINPRIRIVVDGVYKFHTRSKKNTHTPDFDETFTVGNTHRLAIVEVQTYHCPTTGSSVEDECLLGSCRISIERLVEGQKKLFQYFLAAKDGTGLAGTVTITLKTDIQGGIMPFIDDTDEKEYVKRLVRLLLRCNKELLGDIDLLMASVKGLPMPQRVRTSMSNSSLEGISLEKSISGDRFVTFEDLVESLCAKYNCREEPGYTLSLVVEGCTCLERPTMYLPSNVVVVIRGPMQDFVTPHRPFTSNPVWGTPTGATSLDIVDPFNFVLDIILYQVSAMSRWEELARAQVSLSTLTPNYLSARQVFLLGEKSFFQPYIRGMVHLTLRPHGFGAVSLQRAEHVDRFHERLNRFFYRYDQQRIPQVDLLLRSRSNNLEELMSELEIEYGREPGTMELWLSVLEVSSLQSDAKSDLDDSNVVVVITMSDQVVRTSQKRVVVNSRTEIDETFVFDVARETDMIKLEVVRAGQESIVYGRIDFSFRMMQRGVRNDRTLHLVGAAGTNEAYLSGLIKISIFSEQLGHAYSMDVEAASMYAGRLRRYLHLRAPEKLHLVDIVIDTVFDIEGFLRDLAKEYGQEDGTYGVYISLLGCRQLPSRLGFSMNAYVVVRMGITRYETRVVKNSTEPDFFENFEFYVDRPHEMQITIFVMDRYDLGDDREVGRVVIPLNTVQLAEQCHQWLPLEKPNKGGVAGLVGVKYTVNDLHLRDPEHREGEKKRLVEDHSRDRPRPQNPLASLTDRNRRHGNIFSRIGGWRNKLARMAAHNLPHERTMNGGSMTGSDLSSGPSSDHEFFPQPPLNIIDESIHSIDEFCSVSRPGSSHTLFLTSPKEVKSSAAIPSYLQLQPLLRYEKRLHVRVLYCDYLDDKRWIPPSPYVMLSTLEKTQCTKVAFLTRSPKYNETLVFPINDPNNDYLSITVITDTPYGKKCLGHCVLSLKNIQKGTPRTRRVSLVVLPHRSVAMERGNICLTLFGENFGLDYMPSVDAENRFSGFLRKILAGQIPQQLHRLEWYIGEYSLRENELLEKIFALRETGGEEEVAADLKLRVKSVAQLYLNGQLVASGLCFVKVRVGRRTLHRTKSVPGANGCFNIDEECSLTIPHPTKQTLRITVHADTKGTFNCGECELSLLDLHQDVVQERTHFIVKNTGLPLATPVGYITISLLSNNFGSLVSPMDRSDESQYVRLRNYYYYYLREQLHLVDVKYGGIFNVEAHIQRLTEKYGPEAGNYHLHLEVVRCQSFVSRAVGLYCIIQSGLTQFRTNVVQGGGEYVFLEAFDVPIGLPEKEEVQLIVIVLDEGSAVGTEMGRTVIPLQYIFRGKETRLKLPLVYKAQTSVASLHGAIEVLLFTRDFGVSVDQQRSSEGSNAYERVEGSILPYRSEGVHRLSSLFVMEQAQNEGSREETPINTPFRAYSPSFSDIRVRLLGLSGFPEEEAYIKVRLNGGKTLLRTGNLQGERLKCINEEFTIDSSLNIQDVIITLKLAVVKLRRSYVLCYCDFTIPQCPLGGMSRRCLRLFDSKGKFFGNLRIEVVMPASVVRRSVAREVLDLNRFESVVDDVSSLLLKYSPKDLRKLDVMLGRCDDMRTVHRQLRQQLAPRVQATVHCMVHRTELLSPTKGRLMVETVVNEDVVCVMEHKIAAHGAVDAASDTCREFSYPPLRIDITSCEALLFRVIGEGGAEEGELCRAVLSLRALLTPELYDMGEAITVSLVNVKRQRNTVHASLAGTLTFSLKVPAFERYPRTVLLFCHSPPRVNRDFVRYYLDRICSLLKHYDANSLMDIHHTVYEKYVARRAWTVDLPNLLFTLIERWGPEVSSFPPPPPPTLQDAQ
ncbi:hypothetical protein C3747_19g145 [Trypanosoma cruzi]|uniref:C2 domain-containing protein n=1 Tax=Trypanosoma cruzi TaxID=5693 RepID=A0A2V2XBD4_TRYCR|nr:hypothetical protein C3747_19g145 [Trypanosoma cruzi]